MHHEYITVSKEISNEIEERKSKFIANVRPVSSEEEALCFIDSVKSKYWNATHNVYAYIIRNENEVQRFSDDGEPSGTAGIPVLEAIRKMNIVNAVVVITRYFGGIKLGAAGLVRTYGKCASQGLLKSGIVKMILCTQYNIKLDYTLLGKIQNFIAEKGYRVLDTIYTHEVEIIALIPVDLTGAFETSVINLANAKITLEIGNFSYIEHPAS